MLFRPSSFTRARGGVKTLPCYSFSPATQEPEAMWRLCHVISSLQLHKSQRWCDDFAMLFILSSYTRTGGDVKTLPCYFFSPAPQEPEAMWWLCHVIHSLQLHKSQRHVMTLPCYFFSPAPQEPEAMWWLCHAFHSLQLHKSRRQCDDFAMLFILSSYTRAGRKVPNGPVHVSARWPVCACQLPVWWGSRLSGPIWWNRLLWVATWIWFPSAGLDDLEYKMLRCLDRHLSNQGVCAMQ